MKKLALSLALVLSTCVTEPAFANDSHRIIQPVQWWAVFIWVDRYGTHTINPASVDGTHMPQRHTSRKLCEQRTAAVVRGLNKKYGNKQFGKWVTLYCVAARTKLELRLRIRSLNLNFGGRPA